MFDRLRALLAGRNGFDQTAIVLIISAVVFNLIARILFWYPLIIVSIVIMAFAIIRIFSKNVAKRREENYKFMRLSGDLREEFKSWKNRRSESNTYRFFKCPDCKSKLRVLRGKGKIQITCPRCGLRFIRKS